LLGILDIGNTRIKAAVFQGENLVKQAVFNEFNQELSDFFRAAEVKTIFIGSVAGHDPSFASRSEFKVILFDPSFHLPFQMSYKTPQTLGVDRLANACGAYHLNQEKGPVLAIDMGTCIKFDLVDAQSSYQGGGISPGFQMRLNALHHYTAKLPLISIDEIPNLVGKTSHESIASGVFHGIRAEITGLIADYESQFPGIKVFLTGGDAAFFSGSLKNNIFASPLLTMQGLNILAKLNGIN